MKVDEIKSIFRQEQSLNIYIFLNHTEQIKAITKQFEK